MPHCSRVEQFPLPGLFGRGWWLPGIASVHAPWNTQPALRIGQTRVVLLIDAANVVGSRPTGWWRDRAGAARAFVDQVRAAVASGRIAQPVTVVLEGKAREGVPGGTSDGVTVLHAPGSGDDMLIDVAAQASGQAVTLVTADRELRQRAEVLGAEVVGPTWLLELLEV
jgi:hypothetical protein